MVNPFLRLFDIRNPGVQNDVHLLSAGEFCYHIPMVGSTETLDGVQVSHVNFMQSQLIAEGPGDRQGIRPYRTAHFSRADNVPARL